MPVTEHGWYILISVVKIDSISHFNPYCTGIVRQISANRVPVVELLPLPDFGQSLLFIKKSRDKDLPLVYLLLSLKRFLRSVPVLIGTGRNDKFELFLIFDLLNSGYYPSKNQKMLTKN